MKSDGLSKAEFAAAGAMCLILLAGGIQMSINLVRLRHATSAQTNFAITRTAPAFSFENGIDVAGHPVTPMPPPFERRAVVFLLHSSTLREDLQFWTSVSKKLSATSGIRLVAYCNDDDCVQLTRRQVDSLPFPVIQYGEVQGSEALIEADLRGDSIIRSEEWLISKTSTWRSSTQTPEQFSEVISRL